MPTQDRGGSMQGWTKTQHLPSWIPLALLSSSSHVAVAVAWIYRRATKNANRRLGCPGTDIASEITGNEGRWCVVGDLVRWKIMSGTFERTLNIYMWCKKQGNEGIWTLTWAFSLGGFVWSAVILLGSLWKACSTTNVCGEPQTLW